MKFTKHEENRNKMRRLRNQYVQIYLSIQGFISIYFQLLRVIRISLFFPFIYSTDQMTFKMTFDFHMQRRKRSKNVLPDEFVQLLQFSCQKYNPSSVFTTTVLSSHKNLQFKIRFVCFFNDR